MAAGFTDRGSAFRIAVIRFFVSLVMIMLLGSQAAGLLVANLHSALHSLRFSRRLVMFMPSGIQGLAAGDRTRLCGGV